MVQAIWPDGHIDQAPTWRGLEAAIREEQWHTYSRRGFRREMAKRAQVWSNTAVKRRGSAERFLRELERAGLLRLEVQP